MTVNLNYWSCGDYIRIVDERAARSVIRSRKEVKNGRIFRINEVDENELVCSQIDDPKNFHVSDFPSKSPDGNNNQSVEKKPYKDLDVHLPELEKEMQKRTPGNKWVNNERQRKAILLTAKKLLQRPDHHTVRTYYNGPVIDQVASEMGVSESVVRNSTGIALFAGDEKYGTRLSGRFIQTIQEIEKYSNINI